MTVLATALNGQHCGDHRACMDEQKSTARRVDVIQRDWSKAIIDLQASVERSTQQLAKSEAIQTATLELLKTLAASGRARKGRCNSRPRGTRSK